MYVARYFAQVRGLPSDVKRFLWTDGCYGFAVGVIGVLLYLRLAVLGFSTGEIAFVAAVSPAVMLVSVLSMGHVANRFGRARILFYGTLLMAFGAVALALAGNLALVVAAQTVYSLGQSMVAATEFAVVAAATEDDSLKFAISAIFANFMLTIGLGSFMSGVLPGLLPQFGPRYTSTLLLGGIVFFVAPLGRTYLLADGRADNQPARESHFVWRPGPLVWRNAAFSLLLGLSYGFATPFLNLILEREFHFGVAAIGLILGANELALFAGSFLAPWMSERLPEMRALAALFAAGVVFNILLAVTPTAALFVALLLLRSFVTMAYLPLVDTIALRAVHDEERATLQSFRALARNLGRTLSVWGGGTLLAGGLYTWMFAATAVMSGSLFSYRQLLKFGSSGAGTLDTSIDP